MIIDQDEYEDDHEDYCDGCENDQNVNDDDDKYKHDHEHEYGVHEC